MRRLDALGRLSLPVVLVLWAALAAAAPPQEQGEETPEAPAAAPVAGVSEEAPAEDMDGRAMSDLPAPPEQVMTEMGIELMEPPAPVANYVRAVRTGNLVYLAGHGPLQADGTYVRGKLGVDLDIEQGYEAGRLTCLALLASLRAEVGSLDRVRRIVQVEGMVNSSPDFINQPEVINGCSDLLVKLFGERGRHARSAVGMASLPIGIAVEIQMVVEVE